MENLGRKNILLLIPTFADEGGTQKMVYELGLLLAERFNVYECSFDAFNEKHIFKNGNKILSLNSAFNRGGIADKLLGYLQKAKRLRALKKQYNIDITISNLWAADLVNALSGGRSKKLSIGHVNIVGNFQNRVLLKLRYLAGFIYNRFDRVVAVNKYLKDELEEVFKLKNGKATYINNFVDLPKDSQAKYKSEEKKRLANFGRLNPIKNLEPLIQVFAQIKMRLQKVELIIIGAGPLKEHLIAFTMKAGLSVGSSVGEDADVIFTGFHSDPYAVLRSSDVFVFSSKSEGFGLVLVEAMHAGLPIVTSDCPTGGPHVILEGTGDYKPGRIEPEQTPYGYLMPIPDLADASTRSSWEAVIIKLLSDEKLRADQSFNCKRRAQEFSKENIKLQWFDLIDKL